MLRKLYAIVSKSCCVDNPDSPQHQEVLLPGQLYGMIIKEKLEDALNQIRIQINLDVRRGDSTVDFRNGALAVTETSRFYISKSLHPARSIYSKNHWQSKFRHWRQDVQFSCHWQSRFAYRFGSSTSFRLYYRRREA